MVRVRTNLVCCIKKIMLLSGGDLQIEYSLYIVLDMSEAIFNVFQVHQVFVVLSSRLIFPSFHSALLGFLLLLATVKLKSGFSLEHFGVWVFTSKVSFFCVFLHDFLFHNTFFLVNRDNRLFFPLLPGYCHIPLPIYFLHGP